MNKFRSLYPEEIDLRVGRFNETKTNKIIANILLYKDARVDMSLLDEVYGVEGWKREHSSINNNLYCTVSVWSEKINQWVSKQDVGTESMTEKEKGQASDSFKRTCVNLGIGRELYSKGCKNVAIFLEPNESYTNNKGKINLSFGIEFRVGLIESENGQVTKLEIIDQDDKVRYSYPKKSKPIVDKAKEVQLKAERLKLEAKQKAEAERKKNYTAIHTPDELVAIAELKGFTAEYLIDKYKKETTYDITAVEYMNDEHIDTYHAKLSKLPDKA